MLERRGALEMEPTRRLALYGEAAGLHEASGDLAMAIAAWRSGREGDESNLQALDELARSEGVPELPDLRSKASDPKAAGSLDAANSRFTAFLMDERDARAAAGLR